MEKNRPNMRAVIQRVSHASVTIDGAVKSSIGPGYLVLLGIEDADTDEDKDWLARKIVALRVFDDEQGVMNRNVQDINGEVLVVSQFTLMASYRKGNRPSFVKAAPPAQAEALYEYCKAYCKKTVPVVESGIFGADMAVSLCNDGPFTIVLDSDEILAQKQGH